MALVTAMARRWRLGDRAVILYNVGGRAVWHERFVIGSSRCSTFVCTITPDSECYPEDVSAASRDVLAIRDFSEVGKSVKKEDVYRFARAPSLASLRLRRVDAGLMLRDLGAELDDDGEEALRREGAGVGGRGAVGGSPPAPSVGGAMEAPEDEMWLCIMDDKGDLLGLEVPLSLVLSGVVMNGYVMIASPGRVIIGQKLKKVEFALQAALVRSRADVAKAAEGASKPVLDSRVLAVKRDISGHRFMSLREAVLSYSQEDYADWPLSGPRTMRWFAQQVGRLGTDFGPRHSTWRSDWSLAAEDKRVTLHELLCEILHVASTFDGLDLSNLASMELIGRHVQLLERDVRDAALSKQLAAMAKSGQNTVLPQEVEWFTGQRRRGGTALVCPELLKHVAEKASQESAVQKELRKAIEAAKKS